MSIFTVTSYPIGIIYYLCPWYMYIPKEMNFNLY